MSKKNKRTDDPADEMKGASADGAAEGSGDGAEPVVPPKSGGKVNLSKGKADAAHMSMTDLLMEGGREINADMAAELEKFEEPGLRQRGHINLVLLVVLLAALGGGVWELLKVGSKEAREARIRERVEKEQAHMAEQLAKQKKYGNLHIESNPAQAVVLKDGEKIVQKDPATGEEKVGMTPMDVNNLDISQTYKFTLVKDGYEPFEFTVAEHVWTKDEGAEDYKMGQQVDLVPNSCEYWFLYDSGMKKEVHFDTQDLCKTEHDNAVKKNRVVTECACKAGTPPGAPGSAGTADPKKQPAAPAVANDGKKK